MQIPESINNITTETKPDPFALKIKVSELPIDDIVLAIKRSLNANELASFELGLAYFKKDVSTDKQIIKNLFGIFNEAFQSSLNSSNVVVDQKSVISSQIKTCIEGITNNFDSFYNLIFILNNEKNLLDAKNFLFIITGYAISLLKKAHNSTNQ